MVCLEKMALQETAAAREQMAAQWAPAEREIHKGRQSLPEAPYQAAAQRGRLQSQADFRIPDNRSLCP